MATTRQLAPRTATGGGYRPNGANFSFATAATVKPVSQGNSRAPGGVNFGMINFGTVAVRNQNARQPQLTSATATVKTPQV
jgi:hypothetical protein